MQMNGINGLISIAKYWEEWDDPRLVVLVLHNNDLNLVTWEMRVLAGNPRFDASQDVPDFDYAGYARSLGLGGIRVDRPEDIGAAWDRALSADRPTVIDAITDPEVPPLPPHISFEQAKAFLSSMLKGDSHSLRFARQAAKDVLEGVLPGSR
jgi:pyruvate dehydrogenase (quinone)